MVVGPVGEAFAYSTAPKYSATASFRRKSSTIWTCSSAELRTRDQRPVAIGLSVSVSAGGGVAGGGAGEGSGVSSGGVSAAAVAIGAER